VKAVTGTQESDGVQEQIIRERYAMIRPFLDALCKQDEVIAVGSLGGLHVSPWRQLDRFSDIDITVLLEVDLDPALLAVPWSAAVRRMQGALPLWLPNFKFLSPDKVEINLHQQILAYERQAHRVWDDLKCGIYVDGLSILHDPSHALAELVREKTAHFPDRCRSLLVQLGTYVRNLLSDAIAKCVKRGEEDAAWDIVHEATGEVLVAAFFALGRWPCHPKWRFRQLRAMTKSDARVGEFLQLLAPIRQCTVSLDQATTSLIHSVEVVLDIGEAYLPEGYTDLYRYALTYHFEDRQLRARTAADAISVVDSYVQCMADDAWNRANFELWPAI
jgi:hypothetical protein